MHRTTIIFYLRTRTIKYQYLLPNIKPPSSSQHNYLTIESSRIKSTLRPPAMPLPATIIDYGVQFHDV